MNPRCTDLGPASYAHVIHAYYGCDTGCCGHIAYLRDAKDMIIGDSGFQFTHPYGEASDTWAIAFCGQFWPNIPVNLARCEVLDD